MDLYCFSIGNHAVMDDIGGIWIERLCKIYDEKVEICMCVICFFVLFVSQCIHYYEYVMYMENVQFIENYIPMVYTTLIINMFLVFFAVKYGYKEHCAYYFICLLYGVFVCNIENIS
eukprot:TRINITY_DN4539_c0_g1_i1.p1 TRINITY_DN4539_c0_g1~~TRINITY_DN4539_c0_g1_i1.p1  ORF type:complete len:117 (-),score=24.19 TRINITY_DN4539_c0_g1_i1:104-454(-)